MPKHIFRIYSHSLLYQKIHSKTPVIYIRTSNKNAYKYWMCFVFVVTYKLMNCSSYSKFNYMLCVNLKMCKIFHMSPQKKNDFLKNEISRFLKKKWDFEKKMRFSDFEKIWDFQILKNFEIFEKFWSQKKKFFFFFDLDRKNIFWRDFRQKLFRALLHDQILIFWFFGLVTFQKSHVNTNKILKTKGNPL